MIKIEATIFRIDELSIGLFMQHGEDDDGAFHSTTIGFLILNLTIYDYYDIYYE